MNYDKIKLVVEQLTNELSALQVFVQNQTVKDRESEDMANSLITKEKKIAVREAQIITDTHSLEEGKKLLEKDRKDFDFKKNKLQSEWELMVNEKEKLDSRAEDIAKDRLRLQNQEKEQAQRKEQLDAQQERIDLEKEELMHLAKASELKKARVHKEFYEKHMHKNMGKM